MYLDSCILVKLLTVEPNSDFFDTHLQGKPLSTSELASVEVCSALLMKERAGHLSPSDRQRAWTQFQFWTQSEEILVHPLNGTVMQKAALLLQQCHPQVALRSLDAIHLATVDLAQDYPLCTTDERLRQAARFLKLPLFPVD